MVQPRERSRLASSSAADSSEKEPSERSSLDRRAAARRHQPSKYASTAWQPTTPSLKSGGPASSSGGDRRAPRAAHGVKREPQPLELWPPRFGDRPHPLLAQLARPELEGAKRGRSMLPRPIASARRLRRAGWATGARARSGPRRAPTRTSRVRRAPAGRLRRGPACTMIGTPVYIAELERLQQPSRGMSEQRGEERAGLGAADRRRGMISRGDACARMNPSRHSSQVRRTRSSSPTSAMMLPQQRLLRRGQRRVLRVLLALCWMASARHAARRAPAASPVDEVSASLGSPRWLAAGPPRPRRATQCQSPHLFSA